jgi:uncharacterized membrane protein required for colicin V production
MKNGFLKSIFSLTGIITGLYLSTKFNDRIISMLESLKIDQKLLSMISFILIIIFTYFAFNYFAAKLSGINFITKSIDSILGCCFGALKGMVIASLFLLLTTNSFNLFSKKDIDTSLIYPLVINVAPEIYNSLVKYFPDARKFYDELNKLLPEDFLKNNSSGDNNKITGNVLRFI